MAETEMETGCILVIFGGSGDLARRKILPALAGLLHGRGSGLRVLAVGRGDGAGTLKSIREEYAGRGASGFEYLQMRYDEEGFASLKRRCDAMAGSGANLLFHLAVPPGAFPVIAAGLQKAGFVHPAGGTAWSKVMVEKPFGIDHATAVRLNRILEANFPEEWIYRIDHYLGKPGAYFPIGIRTERASLDGIWNGRHIRRITISSHETHGCGDRSGYFDGVGILRDMIQSHLMQLLSLVLMDLPARWDGVSMREEKAKALAEVRPRLRHGRPGSLRGQYAEGSAEPARSPAYWEEAGVDAASQTETYAAVELESGSERWKGVPILLEAGKRMACKETLIEVEFHDMEFRGQGPGAEPWREPPARIRIRVQPEAGAWALYQDGSVQKLEAISPAMHEWFPDIGSAFKEDGYGRLFQQALNGNPCLFVGNREVELAWQCVQPILDDWANPANANPMVKYAPGADVSADVYPRKWRRAPYL